MTSSVFAIVIALSGPLAQATERGYNWSWAVILFGAIIGMLAALTPSKRDPNVRPVTDD